MLASSGFYTGFLKVRSSLKLANHFIYDKSFFCLDICSFRDPGAAYLAAQISPELVVPGLTYLKLIDPELIDLELIGPELIDPEQIDLERHSFNIATGSCCDRAKKKPSKQANKEEIARKTNCAIHE